MSFFGVQLNAQINKLNLAIRLQLQQNKTLYKSFVHYDFQQTGVVSSINFDKALNNNQIFLKKFEIQAYEKAFGGDGQINWHGFLNYLRLPVSEERLKIIEYVFKALDQKQQGQIHSRELMEKFNAQEFRQYKLGQKSRDTIGKELIDLVPLTPQGYITRQEFINFYIDLSLNISSDPIFCKFICSQWGVPYAQNQKIDSQQIKQALRTIRFKLIQKTKGTHEQFLLKEVFNQFDVNKNGKLCEDELATMLVKLQMPTVNQLVRPVLQKLDHDKSGAVEYDEFKNFLFFDPYPI